MNAMPKYVVSKTLTEPTWNATVISAASVDELADAIRSAKQTTERNLLVGGSARLVSFLIRRGLADELRLLTYPVAVGSGLRLFPDGLQAKFSLRETRSFPTGVVLTSHHLVTG
jgi:dihydrofolate reductase